MSKQNKTKKTTSHHPWNENKEGAHRHYLRDTGLVIFQNEDSNVIYLKEIL